MEKKVIFLTLVRIEIVTTQDVSYFYINSRLIHK